MIISKLFWILVIEIETFPGLICSDELVVPDNSIVIFVDIFGNYIMSIPQLDDFGFIDPSSGLVNFVDFIDLVISESFFKT